MIAMRASEVRRSVSGLLAERNGLWIREMMDEGRT